MPKMIHKPWMVSSMYVCIANRSHSKGGGGIYLHHIDMYVISCEVVLLFESAEFLSSPSLMVSFYHDIQMAPPICCTCDGKASQSCCRRRRRIAAIVTSQSMQC
jgi:hypothetical protein